MERIKIKSASSTGKKKTVDIISYSIKNVRSIKLTIKFDPTKVTTTTKQIRWVGANSGGGCASNVKDGVILISWFGAPAVNLVDKKPIIKIQFDCVEKGVSELVFDDITSDYCCRMIINNVDFPDDEKTYSSGKITFK